MAPRASWKGYLKLSLVSCPIALYPAASSSERVSFNRINKKTGNRLKQQLVDAETGETVEKEDIGRGYEIGKGQYLQIEDEEIEKIRIESSHTISIDTFVPRTEIDDRYLEDPYYIAPTDQVGQEAFAVIRDAIRDKGMVALGRVVISRREHVMMLEAFDKGLLATTLRYPYEVRDQAPYFEDIADLKLPADMKELAAHIVDSKTSHFDPSTFVDHYETALVELLRAKQAGRVVEAPKAEPAPAPRHQSHGCAAGEYRRRHKEEAGRGKHESPSRCRPDREEENRTLKPKYEPDASSLEGGIIAFTGRLASMKRADAFALVTQHGGKPRERVTKDTKVLIVGELGWPLQEDGRPSKSLTQAKSYGVPIISERRFLEWVGKISPEEQAKTYTADELAALSKLPADVVEQLSMFGLIEARDGLYGFRDLASARQVAQLLGSGIGLSVITRSLRDIRKWLPDARLSNLRLFPESTG